MVVSMKIGIYAGRFQPFHLGHLGAIEFMLKQVDLLYIVICSLKNESTLDDKNPFEYEEREKMIRYSLPVGASDFIVFKHVKDANSDTEWTEAVVRNMPDGEVVAFSNNEFTIKAFEEHGFKTARIPVKYSGLSATVVRKHIIRGEPWDEFVPLGTAQVIREIQKKNAL